MSKVSYPFVDFSIYLICKTNNSKKCRRYIFCSLEHFGNFISFFLLVSLGVPFSWFFYFFLTYRLVWKTECLCCATKFIVLIVSLSMTAEKTSIALSSLIICFKDFLYYLSNFPNLYWMSSKSTAFLKVSSFEILRVQKMCVSFRACRILEWEVLCLSLGSVLLLCMGWVCDWECLWATHEKVFKWLI